MDLTGKLLIAMPGMGDPRFEHSVVLVCAHSGEGAMGLIINKPLARPTFSELLAQIGVTETPAITRDMPDPALPPVLFGGPVETARGFVLHSPEWHGQGESLVISDDLHMTATRDVLEAIGAGRGPARSVLALGYAGWGDGQLESEILANGWLTVERNDSLLFDRDHGTKWSRALRTLGVDPLTLSASAGRA
jgi:putative transcriptional regulator